MTDFMTPSEMLSAYIDGELDEQSTSLLFYTMANNVELQQELQQLMTIRTATSASAVQVPPYLKQSVMARTIGKEEEPVAVGMSSMTTAGLVIGAAAIASLATAWFLISDSSDNIQNLYNVYSSRSIEIHSPQQPALSITSQSHRTPPSELLHNENPALSQSQVSRSRNNSSLPSSLHAISNTTFDGAPSIEDNITSTQSLDIQNEGNHINSDNVSKENEVPSQIISPAIIYSVPSSYSPQTFGALPKASSMSVFSHKQEYNSLSIIVRGLMSSSMQSTSLPVPSQPFYSDMGIGVFYALNENAELGIEAGYDRWTQVYEGKEADTSVRIEQLYNAPWVGVAYRHSVAPVEWLSNASPYLQGGIGVTAVGPLARIALGLQYPIFQSVTLSAGIEASGLAYQYQGALFSSQRISFISTVSIGL